MQQELNWDLLESRLKDLDKNRLNEFIEAWKRSMILFFQQGKAPQAIRILEMASSYQTNA